MISDKMSTAAKTKAARKKPEQLVLLLQPANDNDPVPSPDPDGDFAPSRASVPEQPVSPVEDPASGEAASAEETPDGPAPEERPEPARRHSRPRPRRIAYDRLPVLTEKVRLDTGEIRCCGLPARWQGVVRRTLWDAPANDGVSPLKVTVERDRYVCGLCRTEHLAPLPSRYEYEEHPKMTTRLVNLIADKILTHTVEQVAVDTAVPRPLLFDLAAWIADIYDRRIRLQAAPRCLGIDEVHVKKDKKKRKKYLVLVDLDQVPARVIDIFPSQKKEVLTDALLRLPELQNVEWIALDMHKPYADAIGDVRKFRPDFQPTLVIDQRHVLELVRAAMQSFLTMLLAGLPKNTCKDLGGREVFNVRAARLTKKDKVTLDK